MTEMAIDVTPGQLEQLKKMGMVALKRGEQAEYCPRCKVNVLPVGTMSAQPQRWHCAVCGTRTVPLDA